MKWQPSVRQAFQRRPPGESQPLLHSMKSFLVALQLLTIVPVRITGTLGENEIVRSTGAFVLVGMVQGMLIVAVEFAAGSLFHPNLVAALIVLALAISNGGFHLDGLADTFDGLSVKSTGDRNRDRQRRLAVMKDSVTGAIGVTAVVFAILIKYLSVRSVADLLPFTYYSSLLLMPAVSKWAMVAAMYHGKPARTDGLGALFLGKVGIREVAFCSISLIVVMAAMQFAFGAFGIMQQYLMYGAALAVTYLSARVWVALSNVRFGGLTGDTFGAIGETSDILYLFTVLAWSRLSI